MRQLPIKRWIAVIGVFTVLFLLTLVVWRQQVDYQRLLLSRHTEDVCMQASRRLEVFMESHLRVASIFSKRWATHESRDYSKQRFDTFASLLIAELPGYHAVALLSPDRSSYWVVPDTSSARHSMRNRPDPELLERSLSDRQPLISAPFTAPNGDETIYAAQAVMRGDSLLGYLVVDFLMSTLINDCFHQRIRSEFDFLIQDGEEIVFASGPAVTAARLERAPIHADRSFPIRNRTWRLAMAPIVSSASAFAGTAHLPVLVFGIVLSLGLSLLVYLLFHRMELFQSARDQQALLSRKVLIAQEEERARVSRELHDELGQLLTALRLELGWLEKRIPAMQESESSVMRNTIALNEQATEELRRMCRGLRPPLLDDLGLEPAVMHLIQELRGRSDLEVRAEFSLDEKAVPISKEIALCTYRILQESLTNISRHARAKRADITLTATRQELLLAVRDDGIGFETAALGGLQGWGLEGMRERANLVGGNLEIHSTHRRGTRVIFRVPLHLPEKESNP